MSKDPQKKINEFKAQLKKLSVEELLNLYVEAMVGEYTDIENYPYIYEAIADIEEGLKRVHSDILIRNLLK